MANMDPSTELRTLRQQVSELHARERERGPEERLRGQQLEALLTVASILVEPVTIESKATRVLEAIADVAEGEWMALRLYDEQKKGLRMVAAIGEGLEEYPPILVLKDAGRISGEAFELGQPVVVNDYPSYAKADPKRVADGIKSAVSLLLKTGGRVIGTINVNSRKPDHFTPERVRFLTAIADGMGVLLDNARLLDDLRESEERYRTLFEQSRDAIFISRRGQPMDCNQACLDLFGYRLDEVLELGTSDLYADPDDRAELTEAMHEQESVQDFAVRFKKKDGTAMDCLVTATLLRDEQGNEVGVHGIVRDITERIRAEEALRASEVEARRRADQVGAINDIAVTIGSILSLEELLPYVATLLRDTFGYYSVNIGLIDAGSGNLVVRASSPGSGTSTLIGMAFKPGDQSIYAWVTRTGRTLVANDVSKEPRYLHIEELKETRAELTVPITIGDHVVGVLDIQSSQMDAFDEMDVVTVETLANQLAVAIENARLFGESRELAVVEERNRMAREIHDTMAQGFTGIVLQLEAAEQAFEDRDPDAINHLSRAKSLARECLQEARRSVWNLLPKALERRTLDEALSQEVDSFNALGSGKAAFSVSGEKSELPPDVQAALLRICQESLANVRRHSGATEVNVDLEFQLDDVSLSVQDNGRGYETNMEGPRREGDGFGLISMEQRVLLLRGSFRVDTALGKGTRVSVRIPTTWRSRGGQPL